MAKATRLRWRSALALGLMAWAPGELAAAAMAAIVFRRVLFLPVVDVVDEADDVDLFELGAPMLPKLIEFADVVDDEEDGDINDCFCFFFLVS